MEKTNSGSFENFQVFLEIGGTDYSDKIRRIRIGSALANVYPLVSLGLFIDSKDILKDQLFGQNPINLKLTLKQSGFPRQEIVMELMYIQSNFGLAPETMNAEQNMSDRGGSQILTVCRQSYKTITGLVNEVYENKTIKEVIQDLTNKVNPGATLELVDEGINSEKIDQILIPPVTYIRAIKYLNDTFGIFNGPMAIFCNYENKVFITNLSKQINKSSHIVIFYVASNQTTSKEIMDKCTDGQHFYTSLPIQSGYEGNKKFSSVASDIHYITKPSDRLYSTVNMNLNDICKEYGVIFKNRDVKFDSSTSRERYEVDKPGYSTNNRDSESFAISGLSRMICNLSSLQVTLNGFLDIARFFDIGKTVLFAPYVDTYTELSGDYILRASDIVIQQVRNKEWGTSVNLYLFRTNKTI